MARYTGPRLRKVRRLGVALPGLTPKDAERRPYPPGQHGQQRRRARRSDHLLQLVEKQKLRFHYGMSESQLRRIVEEARGSAVATDRKILELLESRLDNVVFRAGLAPTIPAARQLVGHGHILVGGHRVNVPSYRVREGDVVEVAERSRKLLEGVAEPAYPTPAWLAVDRKLLQVRVQQLPDSDSALPKVDAKLVIEYYAKRL